MKPQHFWPAFLLAAVSPVIAQQSEKHPVKLSFSVGKISECSIVHAKPSVECDRPVVLTYISTIRPSATARTASSPTAFLARLYRSHSLVTREFVTPAEVNQKKEQPEIQALGPHSYALLLPPGKSSADLGELHFPVTAGDSQTVQVQLRYALPSRELLAARTVIYADRMRRADSYADIEKAWKAGHTTRFYIDPARSTVQFEWKSLQQPLTVKIVKRPVPFEEISKREGREPVWHFEGAWVFPGKHGSSTLVRGDERENWPNAGPAFFAAADPTSKRAGISLDVDMAEFQRTFPKVEVQPGRGNPHVRFDKPMAWTDLLEFSKLFDGTRFALGSRWSNAGAAIISNPAKEAVDPATVRKKIAGLGLRDDSLKHDERPRAWLLARRHAKRGGA